MLIQGKLPGPQRAICSAAAASLPPRVAATLLPKLTTVRNLPHRGLAALCLALAAGAPARAGNTCGMAGASPGLPNDPNAMVSDLSLEYVVNQPASMTTCAHGYIAAKCGDFEKANIIFDKCIAKRYAGAMLWKGLMYEMGSGVPRDPAAAAALFRRAAEGADEGYAALGKLHYATALYEGNGVERNEAEAYKWFEAAAAQGSADAQEFLRTGHHTASRNLRGEGVGTPGEPVDGQRLLPQTPPPAAALGTLNRWHGVALALMLAGLMAAGAWRQLRQARMEQLA